MISNIRKHTYSKHHMDRYIKFIELRMNRNLPKSIEIEKHHILPKSLFPQYQDLNIYLDNMIKLTLREHYIAHMLLAYATDLGGMWYAYYKMTNTSNANISSRMYERMKRKFLEFNRENHLGRIHVNKDGIIKKVKGVDVDEYLDCGWELGTNIRNIYGFRRMHKNGVRKFVHIDDINTMKDKGWILGWDVRSGTYGKKVVNDGTSNKYIFENELEEYLNKGWYNGSCHESSTKNFVRVFKGETLKLVSRDDLPSYINDGWEIGHPGVRNKNVVTKDGNISYVSNEELEDYLNKGWVTGRGDNEPCLGKFSITKDGKDKKVSKDELQSYLDGGWVRGSSLGGKKRIHKNGKYKFVNEGEDLERHLRNGWSRHAKSPTAGRKKIMKNGKIKYVQPSELDMYYSDGWT